MEQEVQEYFNNYFGGTLNESTSDEEILEAVNDLVYSTELVLNEIKKAKGDGLLQNEKASKKGKRVAKVKDMIKIKLAPGKKIGTRSADIGPGGKEYNVKTDAEWDAQNEETERERSIRMIEIMAKKKKDYPKQSARARKMLLRLGRGSTSQTTVKDVSEKYTVKYAKHRRGEIQTASFDTAEKAKEHLAKVGQEGYKGIVSKDGKPLKDKVDEMKQTTLQSYVDKADKQINTDGSTDTVRARSLLKAKKRLKDKYLKTGKPQTPR